MSFVSRNHPQQVAARGALRDVDDRTTHPSLFDPLHARFGFTLDVAAATHNARVPRFFSIEEDGLAQSWAGEVVWCNPPYSNIRPWIEKAWLESNRARGIVMLLPANRTEQGWWQELIEPFRDRDWRLRTEFIRGRQRFIQAGRDGVGPNERPPFGVVLLIWLPSAPCVVTA
jgi:phage N-6-adenine-methyltransferase